MLRRVLDRQSDSAQIKDVAVTHGAVGKAIVRRVVSADADLSATRGSGKSASTTHEIFMDVRLHHVPDGLASFSRELEVLLDVHLGVNNGSDPSGVVADQVAGVSQFPGQYLFKNESHCRSFTVVVQDESWTAGFGLSLRAPAGTFRG